MDMFGIGFQEMLIILVVVLIFFGPKRLPDLAKSLGKGIAEFKKASEEIRKGIDEAVKEGETATSTDGQVPRAQDAQERPTSTDGQVPRAQDAQERPAAEPPSPGHDAPSASTAADGKDTPPQGQPPAPPSASAG